MERSGIHELKKQITLVSKRSEAYMYSSETQQKIRRKPNF